MSSANVQSIQALEDLKGSLAQFRAEAQSALDSAALEIQRTQDWIQERVQHWGNVVRRCEEAVAQAQAALARCEASGYRDRDGHYHQPDCSAYEAAVFKAKQRLSEAQAELGRAQQARQAIEQAVAAYQREAQRLARALENDVAKASASLGQSIAKLRAYLATSAPASAAVASAAPNFQTDNAARQGADFEAWAVANVFHGKRRVIVPIELNQHLADYDEEGIGLLKQRSSDNYVDEDGSLWDAKAYGDDSIIDREQLRDYSLVERAKRVFDADGKRVSITSTNYLFANRAAAEKNRAYLQGLATAWYVEWQTDGRGIVKILEN